MDSPALARRSRTILKDVVEQYIREGKPVGSTTLSRRPDYHLSSATIRNILAELEEEGFLEQPHPSAGRIPTGKGYRYYVDALMPSDGLPKSDEQIISRSFDTEDDVEFEVLRDRATSLLTNLSRYIGLIIVPRLEDMILHHIEFIRLSSRHLLVIIVTQSLTIRNKLIRMDSSFSQVELDRLSSLIRERFIGFTLRDMYNSLVKEMGRERDRTQQMLKGLRKSILSCIEENEDRTCTEMALDLPARFSLASVDQSVLRLSTKLDALESRRRLIKLLADIIDEEGVQIRIGSECNQPGLDGFSLIAAKYGDGSRGIGSLGILGPTRLEYSRCVAMVDQVAAELSKAIGNNLAQSELR